MKKIAIMLLCFYAIGIQAQLLNWVETAGGSGRDLGECCVIGKDGSYILAGMFYNTLTFESEAAPKLIGSGSRDVVLAKYSSDQEYIWAVGIGSPEFDMVRKVAVDDSNNIYLTGYCHVNVAFGQENGETLKLDSFPGSAIYFAKYDPEGAVMWAKTIHPPEDYGYLCESIGFSVRHGKIYISGLMQGLLDFDPGDGEMILSAREVSKNIFFACYDLDGEVLWAKVIRASKNQYSYDLFVDEDTNIYVSGPFSGNVDFDPGPEEYFMTSNSEFSYNAFLAKYNSEGDFEFARNVTDVAYEGFACDLFVTDTEIYLSGLFQGVADFEPGIEESLVQSAGGRDIFFASYSKEGSLNWFHTIGSGGEDYPLDISVSERGDIILIGVFELTVDFDPAENDFFMESMGMKDAFLARYDTQGNFIKAFQIGGIGDNYLSGIDIIGDTWLIAGSYEETTDLDPDPLIEHYRTSYGAADIALFSMTDPENVIFRDTTLCPGDSVFLQGEYRFSEGSYFDTIPLENGKDSIIITRLSLLEAVIEQHINICEGDSIFLGGAYQKSSGTYTDIYSLSSACDSVIITTLIVIERSLTNQKISICEGDSVFLEGQYQKEEGIYYDIYETYFGCDSVIITTLSADTRYKIIINEEICDKDSILFAGDYIRETGVYVELLTTSEECDSILILTLEQIETPWKPVIEQIKKDKLHCTVQGEDIIYQWFLDDSPLEANTGTLTVTQEGEYRVMGARGDCISDTSDIFFYNIDALRDLQDLGIRIMPNPGSGICTVQINQSLSGNIKAEVFNLLGEKVMDQYYEITGYTLGINLSTLSEGMYLLKLESGNKQFTGKFVINR